MTEQRGDAMVDPKTLTRAGLATEVKAYERPLLTLERPAGRRKHSELLNGYTGTNDAALKVCFITREYPPNVYGGAGVHIKNLARALTQVMDVEVRCFGDQDLTEGRLRVKGYQPWGRMAEGAEHRFNSVLGTFSTNLSIVRDPLDAIVHAHTWYAAMAGFMAKELYDVPLVVTVHSLEPLRPWKEEQLGRSYHLSAWIERVALEAADRVIAVSSQSKSEILTHFNIPPERVTVIHNGIDPGTWKPSLARATRQAYGIEGDYILFVGRASRQKGMVHLLEAMKYVAPVCDSSAAPPRPIPRRSSRRSPPRSRRRPGVCGSARGCARSSTSSSIRTARSSLARRCTSRSASSTSRRWPASGRWWPAPWAASPRSWSPGRRACSCRRPTPGRWPTRSTASCATVPRPMPWVAPAAGASRNISPGP